VQAVVAVKVDGLGSGLVDGFPSDTPGTLLLELPEPGLDERLGLEGSEDTTAVRNSMSGRIPT
jgi:hypothetical protein